MSFQAEKGTIRWKLHFNSQPEKVFAALATDEGRSHFWAESAVENNGTITFHILNYEPYTGRVLNNTPKSQFTVEYFGTIADFTLEEDNNGGTDLTLVATNVDESFRMEMTAGWISVLMAMKAYVDHGVNLRNHDMNRTWSDGYADN